MPLPDLGKLSFAGTFRSLRGRNYRLWAMGAVVSNIGTWMQRIAQDWIVLTQLTHKDAAAASLVVSLQFLPQVLLLPLTGYAADHFDRRKLLLITQAAMGALALGLGLLTLAGRVQLWHVYVFAFLLGCATAFDAPARHTFVSELVLEEDLSNAVALNSTSFNAARMIGPAIAGVLISAIGSGWVFVLNAVSFGAVLLSLSFLRRGELHLRASGKHARGGLLEGLRYIRARPDLKAALAMLTLIGAFGLNFPIFISTMSVIVFRAGADRFGLLTSTMAVGSIAGSLLAARRRQPRAALLPLAALVFGIGLALAALMPAFWLFGAALILVGVAGQTFTTTGMACFQLATEPRMRGRVMAIVLATALGGMALGSPVIGWAAKSLGPRWGLGVGAAAAFAAALLGFATLTQDSLAPAGLAKES